MDIKALQINLKNLMNKWFYTREQIHQLLEEYVIVDNEGVLRVGLPSAQHITLETTNNAITTADVAEVKATVTGNTDQELVYGVPVQFVNRATREVLYNGTTDENGECLFQYFTEEAEILPIQARISNDFIFRDDGRLNSYEAWNYNSNVTIQHISTHSIVSRADTSSSIGTLGTILLYGYCDIDFKVKIPSDGSADVMFCRITERTSSNGGVSDGLSNTFKLSDLNLTTEKWYNFHISVLDDRIVLHCKDNGETKRIWLDSSYPYYRFELIPGVGVPTICFSDMKITRCSDDLSMFIKDKGNLLSHNVWSGTDYAKNITDFTPYNATSIVSSSNEWSNNGERSLKCECTKDNSFDGVRILNLGNVSATVKLTLYNPAGSIYVRLWSPNNSYKNVIVPSSDNPVEVSLYSDDCYYLQLFSSTKQIFYVDSITLIK